MKKNVKKLKFTSKRRTREQVEKAARSSSRNRDFMFSDSFKMFKPRDNKNKIRILPPTWDDSDDFGLPIFVNYEIGPDNNTYLSLHEMKGVDDPIFEERQRALKAGDEAYANSLLPRKRILCWLIDRKAEDEGPQLWPMPFSLARQLNQMSLGDDTGEASRPISPNELGKKRPSDVEGLTMDDPRAQEQMLDVFGDEQAKQVQAIKDQMEEFDLNPANPALSPILERDLYKSLATDQVKLKEVDQVAKKVFDAIKDIEDALVFPKGQEQPQAIAQQLGQSKQRLQNFKKLAAKAAEAGRVSGDVTELNNLLDRLVK